MKRNTFYPSRTGDQVTWLLNLCNKLGGYAGALGLTPAQEAEIIADCGWLAYVLQNWLAATKSWAKACTDAATLAQTGDGSALMVLPVFTPPALPAGVAAVLTGALLRIFTNVQLMKDSGVVSEFVQTDLGIVGSEMAAPDYATVQPVFKVEVTAPNIVAIGWTWNGLSEFLDQIEIEVDRGTGAGFVFLVQDSTPGYNDSTPHPTTPAKWTYRAIFRVNDVRVGLWSASVSTYVGG